MDDEESSVNKYFESVEYMNKKQEYINWLYDDVQQNRKIIDENDSQLARRNYLRSLFALYELLLVNLRETTAKLLVDEFSLRGEWNFHELYPLMDETARLSENGQLKLEYSRLPFLSLLIYTLRIYAKHVGYSNDFLTDYRWNSFRDSVKIRHRITHPKFLDDIDIGNDELTTIATGLAWWNDTLRKLRKAHYLKLVGHENIDQ
jgi:hypothetical protein